MVIRIFLLFAQSLLAHNGPSQGLIRWSAVLHWHSCVAFGWLRRWGKDLGSAWVFCRRALNYFKALLWLEGLQPLRSALCFTSGCSELQLLPLWLMTACCVCSSGCCQGNKPVWRGTSTWGSMPKHSLVYIYLEKLWERQFGSLCEYVLENKPLVERVLCWF